MSCKNEKSPVKCGILSCKKIFLVLSLLIHKLSTQVNTDGVLTFAAPLPGLTPAPFPLPPPTSFGDISVMIAPFWADHDNTNAGKIFYRFSDDEDLLEEVATNITNAFARHNKLEPTLLFIATWDSVPLSDGDQTMVCVYMYNIVFAHGTVTN